MNQARRVIVVQAAIGAVCAAVFFAVGSDVGRSTGTEAGVEASTSAGLSALYAVLASWIPSAYYAFVQTRVLNATRLLLHGVLKTLLTVTLMAVCIVALGIEPLGFFVTFAAMQLGYFAR